MSAAPRFDPDCETWPTPKTAKPADFGPLFLALPDTPADYAEPAANTDAGAKLLEEARKAANGILNADRSVAMWQVRLALESEGVIANDGDEALAALGALGKRMGLAVVDRERPPAWAQKRLPQSHANLGAVWCRPVDAASYCPAERKRRIGKAA